VTLNGIVLVDFKAGWCKNCTALKPELDKLSSLYPTASFYVADVDEIEDCSESFEVHHLPCIQIYSSGRLAVKYEGSDINEIRRLLQNVKENETAFSFAAPTLQPEFPTLTELARSAFPSVVLPDGNIRDQSSIVQTISDLELRFVFPGSLYGVPTNAVIAQSAAIEVPELSDDAIRKMYEYKVPTTSADGTCSNTDKLADIPFNLAINAYNLVSTFDAAELKAHTMTARLYRLSEVVRSLHEITKADWIGIYRMMYVPSKNHPTLVKESYFGAPSRAIFPVTAEFSKISTNSWVALHGKGRVIMDTGRLEEGVSYYKCDGKVQSELCVPILAKSEVASGELLMPGRSAYSVIGIIDLESWNPCHFSQEVILEVLKIAFDLGEARLFSFVG
jgi:L-methionine (R)-S-oxide reductase